MSSSHGDDPGSGRGGLVPGSVRWQARRGRGLREECRRLSTAHPRRRALPTTLHVGDPGGVRVAVEADPSWDDALRADLLTRLLDDAGAGCAAWLSRAGVPGPDADDVAWLAAARVAHGRLGREPRLYSVTRRGWVELVTGERRSYVRLRTRLD